MTPREQQQLLLRVGQLERIANQLVQPKSVARLVIPDTGVVHFKSKSGGIPAISTLTMGSASCDKYTCSSSGVLSDSGDDVTVYNTAGAFAANTLGIAAYNEAGLLVAIVENCS